MMVHKVGRAFQVEGTACARLCSAYGSIREAVKGQHGLVETAEGREARDSQGSDQASFRSLDRFTDRVAFL
jgi:hypothetical protein